MSLVRFDDVSLAYGEQKLLTQVEFDIEPGERVCLGRDLRKALRVPEAHVVAASGSAGWNVHTWVVTALGRRSRS